MCSISNVIAQIAISGIVPEDKSIPAYAPEEKVVDALRKCGVGTPEITQVIGQAIRARYVYRRGAELVIRQ